MALINDDKQFRELIFGKIEKRKIFMYKKKVLYKHENFATANQKLEALKLFAIIHVCRH
jgi:septin family protein